ncbi:glucose-1-phosphate adenylyltransferase subunit GlgD [Lactobacillus intestinalis]|uniref:Glucose-1-phosphate adenylyltransferase subunit GlgD n=1 Tax=Lactobacillus intestinalis TaxID=151781 RepID=A0A4S2BNR4_9LACO|nr:glucose-1-phosphate adenylyltransferase subunit GlgD [Lactobacillus intestinalis]TGY15993.1 glucose-1-phosphate adenylyltransferase subunit GlgD [Lactobacillus intestinalis]
MRTNKMCAIFANKHEYNQMRPLTDKRSLSTLYFAGKYRIMDFPLSSIVNAGINNVYTLINQEKVRSYFDHLGGGKEWGLDTIGSYDYIDFYQSMMQQKARGENYFDDVINFLETANLPYTVFMGNKMIGNFDLQSVLHFHQENNNKVTAVFKRVKSDNVAPDDQIFILDNDNTVLACQETIDSQKLENYNLALNIFVVNTAWLISELKKAQRSGSSTDIAKRLSELSAKYRINAYEYTGYLRNIHDIKSYYDANMDMLNKKDRDSLLYGNQRIITRIRNEVGAYFSTDSEVKNSMFATGSRISGKTINSVVSRRVVIESGSEVKNSIIMSNSQIEKGSHVEYAIIDKNAVIEKNVTVKGTKEHPAIVTKGSVIDEDLIVK